MKIKQAFTAVGATYKRFSRDECGAAYSLSVVLIIPMYIAFLTFAIEWILLANSGQALVASMQIAHRSTQSWLLHRDSLALDGKTIETQVHATLSRNLIPFVTTRVSESSPFDEDFVQVLEATGMRRYSSLRYARKLHHVANNLRIKIVEQYRQCDGYLVRVEYDSPLWFPMFTPLLASGSSGGNSVRTMVCETWVAVPASDMHRQNMGIPYSPLSVTRWPN